MMTLESVRLVQFFLYEQQYIRLDEVCGVFGPNGSVKSSLLDAVQIAMMGAHSRLAALNPQADENATTRTIRGYCLGQYGETPEQRARDRATTYITLIWRNSKTNEPLSMGVCLSASSDREDHDVLGRYLLRGHELSMGDHLEVVNGAQRPLEWKTFRVHVIERAKTSGEDPIYPDAERFIRATLLALRGPGGAPNYQAFVRAFRFALRMRFGKSVHEIVRNDVLEPRPTNVRKFREVTESFRRLAEMVKQVEAKIAAAHDVERHFVKANEASRQSATWLALAKVASLQIAVGHADEASQNREMTAEALARATAEEEARTGAVIHARQEVERLAGLREQHSAHADFGSLQAAVSQHTQAHRKRSVELEQGLSLVQKTLQQAGKSPLLVDQEKELSAIAARLATICEGIRATPREHLSRELKNVKRVVDGSLTDIMKGQSQAEQTLIAAQGELETIQSALLRARQGKRALNPSSQTLLNELVRAGLHPTPLCDLVRIGDPDWQAAIEAYLGPHLQALLVPDTEEDAAFSAYEAMQGPKAVFGAKIVRTSRFADARTAEFGSVAELISGDSIAAVAYLRKQLGSTKRASSKGEALAGQRTLTKEGMLTGDTIERLALVNADQFLIGADRPGHLHELQARERACVLRVSQAKAHRDSIAALTASLFRLPREVEFLNAWDEMQSAKQQGDLLTKRLSEQADDAYTALCNEEQRWRDQLSVCERNLTTYGDDLNAAKLAASVSAKEAEERMLALQAAQSEAKAARSHAEFDPDYASRQWEELLTGYADRYSDMAAKCAERQREASRSVERALQAGTLAMGEFISTFREKVAEETRLNWRLSHAWITDILAKLRSTELVSYREKMEDAYRASQETFRSDVAIVIKTNLEWLDQTIGRLNDVLRTCPAFSNGERYQFQSKKRPQYRELLKFIQDIADFGGDANELGGTLAIPEQFKDLLEEKLSLDKRAGPSPLDDYREFFEFDIEILREQVGTNQLKVIGHLSKRIGPGSGGEHRAPLYVIAGAALASVYRLERGHECGMRLIMLDEAFNKMDMTNIIATMRYLEDLGLQVFMASPGENLGLLSGFLHRYYDTVRDPNLNVIEITGHSLSPEARRMCRMDLPEFNQELIEEELARISRSDIGPATGMV